MSINSWLQNLRSALAPSRGQRQHGRQRAERRAERRRTANRASYKPVLEALEDRLTPSGDFAFALGLGSSGSDSGRAVATDNAGNVYATGSFIGTVDFDPGVGIVNLVGAGNDDVFVAKYSLDGTLQWAKRMGGTSFESGQGIAVDGVGNVYTTGYFFGTSDFDPGVGFSSLTSAGTGDIFVSKLDSAGNFLWARSMGGTFDEGGQGIAVDGVGNVYTTGYFQGTADFDSGAGITNLTSAGGLDIFVSKLDSAGNFLWARRMGGTSNDIGLGIAVDSTGNACTTGYFFGTSDFDPGVGISNLTSAGSNDIFVSKLDSAGTFLWARRMGGSDVDAGQGIAVDSADNVYTTGYFTGTADFDPGVGISNRTSTAALDIFVSRLDSAGTFLWARSMGGNDIDAGQGIAVDSAGTVYTTGLFNGTADFDPGVGVSNRTSAGGEDIFVSRLDSAGNFLWAGRMGSVSRDYGYGIAVDSSGTVYTTGYFTGTADFDPGVGISNRTSAGGQDIFLSRLTGDRIYQGDFGMALALSGQQVIAGRAVATDDAGNMYVTGSFSGTVDFDAGPATVNLTSAGNADVIVAKYAASGRLQWARNMGGSDDDSGQGIAVDSAGNVYTTGYFSGTADFDPGVGISNRTSAGGPDIFVSKLDSAGNFLWARGMGGSGFEVGQGIAVDSAGNVCTTGYFYGTADFDPGAAVSNLTSAGNSDSFVSRLDSAGNLLWARSMGGSDSDAGHGIAVDSAGNVYTTGYFFGTSDFDPGAGISNLTSAGSSDSFVSRLDSAGNLLWARSMGGSDSDAGHGIAVDSAGNVYTTGSFAGTADFDPGRGISNLTSAGSNDIFVSKLDSGGNFLWARRMGSDAAAGQGIAVDSAGNVYTTGWFRGTADFDPGAGISNLTSAGSRDIFVSRLDSAGNFLWARRMGGSSDDAGQGIAVDSAGNVYTTGYFVGTADFGYGASTVRFSSTGPPASLFVQKLENDGPFPLLTPGLETTDTTPTLAWKTTPGAIGYELWVDNRTTGQGEVIRVNTLSSPFFTPSTALPLGNYTAWRRPVFAGNQFGNWSAGHNFTITGFLTPVLKNPPAETASSMPTISWQAGSQAVRFELWVDNVGTGQSQLIHRTDLTVASFTPASALPLGQYRVYVRAFTASDQASAWSLARDFRIVTVPAPTVTAPAAATLETKPLIAWTAIAEATRYELWVDNVSSGQSKVIFQTNLTLASFTPANPLPAGTFRVWVRAVNAGSVASNWSAARDFTVTVPAAPLLIAPGSVTTSASPTFGWNGVAGAIKYQLWVDNTTTGQSQIIFQTDLATTSFTPASALSVGSYTAWVRSVNVANNPGPWSQTYSFQIVALTLSAPAAETVNQLPTLVWNAVSGATRYELWVDNVSTGQSGVIQGPGLFTTSFTPAANLPFGLYRAWVRSFNAANQASSWSPAEDFRIVPLLTPTPYTPSGLTLTTLPVFTWSVIPQAARYDLWVNNVSTGQYQVIRKTDLTNSLFTPLATPSPGTYQFWVSAIDASGVSSEWSQVLTFTIVA